MSVLAALGLALAADSPGQPEPAYMNDPDGRFYAENSLVKPFFSGAHPSHPSSY